MFPLPGLRPAGATLGTFNLGGSYPGAIAFDGTNMWVTSSAQGNNVTEL